MSVQSIDVVGTVSSEVEVAGGMRTHVVEYLAVTNDADDQGLTCMTATGIPSIGEFYQVGNSFDRGAFPRTYRANLKDRFASFKVWVVLVTFRSSVGGGDTEENPTEVDLTVERPWEKPARVRGWGVDREREQLDHYTDADDPTSDEALLNSARGLYPIAQMIPWSYPGIIIEKDYETLPSRLFTNYANRLNKFEFFGEPPQHWKLASPNITRRFTGDGVRYFNVIFEFEFNDEGILDANSEPQGWNGKPTPDLGYTDEDGNGYEGPKSIMYSGGPMALDGMGSFILGDAAVPPTWPEYGHVRYLTADFADLDIPTDWEDDT